MLATFRLVSCGKDSSINAFKRQPFLCAPADLPLFLCTKLDISNDASRFLDFNDWRLFNLQENKGAYVVNTNRCKCGRRMVAVIEENGRTGLKCFRCEDPPKSDVESWEAAPAKRSA